MKALAKSGLPAEPIEVAQRYSLGLKVTAETKNFIDREAKRSGRTQSQVAELLIEKALVFERVVAGMNTTMDEIRRGNVEAAFRAEGYRWVHSPYGKIWLPHDYPLGPRSGFVEVEEKQK
jgi:hypothetical protein